MKKKIALIFLFFLIQNLDAQTIGGGVLTQNTKFQKKYSPYLIVSNLVVPLGFTLEIEAGTELQLSENVEIIVNGNLKAIGNQNDTIFFKTPNSNVFWNGITGTNCSIEFDFVKLTDSKKIISQNYGNLNLKNTCFFSIYVTEGITLHYLKNARFEYCKLFGIKELGKIDAIDCDAADSLIVTNCKIENWGDDAIDVGTQTKYAYIAYNFVRHCDYGLSVGESSKAFAERNIFMQNHGGFQSHNGADLIADHNTLYNNTFGIQCFHGGDVNSGGNAQIQNTIFSNRNKNDFQTQTSSLLAISYCISDKENLPGNNNSFANPSFIDTTTLNFGLNSDSPCIDFGNPAYSKDDDGSRTDVGAIPYYSGVNNIIDENIDNQFLLFPNPSNGNFYLQNLTEEDIDNLTIFNSYGVVVFSSDFNEIKLEFLNFASGIYVCIIEKNTYIITKKIIVF